jgi:PIN domain nuclease of toxin-antitoxin system
MNLLLDTHTYIWFSTDNRELSSAVKRMIEDPFDRIIVAQSLCEGMKLLSVDTIFDHYSSDRIW